MTTRYGPGQGINLPYGLSRSHATPAIGVWIIVLLQPQRVTYPCLHGWVWTDRQEQEMQTLTVDIIRSKMEIQLSPSRTQSHQTDTTLCRLRVGMAMAMLQGWLC